MSEMAALLYALMAIDACLMGLTFNDECVDCGEDLAPHVRQSFAPHPVVAVGPYAKYVTLGCVHFDPWPRYYIDAIETLTVRPCDE